ncbi:hypothetical protein [Pseudochrobactrum sp. AO18b]|uniref:hypothetical protein n=1 Tax=Pseudochrobactrum sp. AO18b TaxID=1201036 RepID=UPI0012EB60C3|nr:hypothetical protein [Pseudochrobactrum sp. AO18b]
MDAWIFLLKQDCIANERQPDCNLMTPLKGSCFASKPEAAKFKGKSKGKHAKGISRPLPALHNSLYIAHKWSELTNDQIRAC